MKKIAMSAALVAAAVSMSACSTLRGAAIGGAGGAGVAALHDHHGRRGRRARDRLVGGARGGDAERAPRDQREGAQHAACGTSSGLQPPAFLSHAYGVS